MISNEPHSNALRIAVLACVALIALSAAAAGLDTTTQSDELGLTVDDQAGDTVTVLIATDTPDVAGFEANVTFDPSVVAVASVEGVDLVDPVANVNNEAGWVHVSQAQATGVDAPTTTAITFEIVADGTMELEFVDDQTAVFASNGSAVPVTLSGASTDVSVPDDEGDEDGDGVDSAPPGDPDDPGDSDESGEADDPDGGDDENADGLGAGFVPVSIALPVTVVLALRRRRGSRA